jgi:hypothetical protein
MVTDEETTLAAVKREIGKLSADGQIEVAVRAQTIRNIANADGYGAMALALVGAELAAKL